MNAQQTFKDLNRTWQAPAHHRRRVLLYFFLHPALLVGTGFCTVRYSLPLMVKTGLFGLVCLALSWLLYKVLMQSTPAEEVSF